MRLNTVLKGAIPNPVTMANYIILWLTHWHVQGKAASSKGKGSGKVTSVDGQVCLNAASSCSGPGTWSADAVYQCLCKHASLHAGLGVKIKAATPQSSSLQKQRSMQTSWRLEM